MKKRMLIVGVICSMVVLPLQGCSNSSEEVSSSIEDSTELADESADEITTESTGESADEITGESTGESADEITTESTGESADEITTELITESITDIITENTTQAPIVQSNGSDAIYVTKTGKKYHYNNNCNGATYIEITLEQLNAEYSTLEPCSKCAM